MDDLIKITLGVFIGALAAMLAHTAIQEARAEHKLRKAAQQLNSEINRSNEQMRKQQEARDAAAHQAAQVEAARRNQLDAAKQLLKQRAEDKEAAWARFYKPTPQCANDPNTMACANEHARSRKVFESDDGPQR